MCFRLLGLMHRLAHSGYSVTIEFTFKICFVKVHDGNLKGKPSALSFLFFLYSRLYTENFLPERVDSGRQDWKTCMLEK